MLSDDYIDQAAHEQSKPYADPALRLPSEMLDVDQKLLKGGVAVCRLTRRGIVGCLTFSNKYGRMILERR